MSSELAFRAQTILRDQRALYDYWRKKADVKDVPFRSDIDPVDIPGLLPYVSLIDTSKDLRSMRYRLAGTRVREIYGTELTNRLVFEHQSEVKQDYWTEVYRQVVHERRAMQGSVRGPARGREHLVLFWLRLPLSAPSGAIERILGYDAALPSTLFVASRKDSETQAEGLKPPFAMKRQFGV